jgi:hypothetical protein
VEVDMCIGGRLLADFVAGTSERPAVPEVVSVGLTQTVDGQWVVWAHKIAHRQGVNYRPLSHGECYPPDAVAACARGGSHRAPDPRCTCGFHALSSPWPGLPSGAGVTQLEVALSGRVLAFDWPAGGLLYRGERQTVIRVHEPEPVSMLPPDDPEGRLARVRAAHPRSGGPLRLRLPRARPPLMELNDDAGYCLLEADPPGIVAPPAFATVGS